MNFQEISHQELEKWDQANSPQAEGFIHLFSSHLTKPVDFQPTWENLGLEDVS